ncbi:MAG: 3D domain-containing protein, partial [Sedimentisphaerales bacterium]|nr:3D domain-containing protein [Sedimentisphaerales bacterium]
MNGLSHIVSGIGMVVNNSIVGKKFCAAKAAVWFAAVFIAAILAWLCISGRHTPTQSLAMIPLSTSIIVPAELDTSVAAATSPEDSQITPAPKPTPLPAVVKEKASQWRTVRMRVTAYCPCPVCCGPLAQGVTANGRVIRQGDRFVAAPKKYPFGTEIIVPRYNRDRAIKVLDRGGAITGNRLDLFFPSHTKAAKWGVKYLNVKVRANRQQKAENQYQ